MSDKGTIDNLAASLRRMEENGAAPEACAQAHPEANGRLRDLLSLAAELRAIARVEPDAATIAKGRERMLAALEARDQRRLFAFAGLLAPAAAKAAAIVIAIAILSGAAVATSDALGGSSITRGVFERVGITHRVVPSPTGGQAGHQNSAPPSDAPGGASTSDGQNQQPSASDGSSGGTPAPLSGVFATPKPTATASPTGPHATATPRPTPTHGGTIGCPDSAFPQWLPDDDCDATPTPHPTATSRATPTPTPKPSQTPRPTPKPTPTPTPTRTPRPTETPEPSETPEPHESPEPTKTPKPSETPEPSHEPGGDGCEQSWHPSHLDEDGDCPGTPTPTPGGGPSPTPTETPEPDETPEPTRTPKPSKTPRPSETPHDDD